MRIVILYLLQIMNLAWGNIPMNSIPKFLLSSIIVFIISLGCNGDSPSNGRLPSDPNDWVCQNSLIPSSQAEIDEWCEMNLNDLGKPLPEELRNPPPLALLDMKNNYDLDLKTFIKERLYDTELGWKNDEMWRMTGPYVGEIGDGQNLTTHNAVKIYYSPEVVEWLCNNRQGDLPDGAMVVKEVHLINDQLDITLDNEGCMVINAEVEPDFWTPAVKQSGSSFDGWYWSIIYSEKLIFVPTLLLGNPPVFDRSGIVNDIFYFLVGDPPLLPDPLWYPTGYIRNSFTKIPDIVPLFNQYGDGFCITCHSMPENEYIFSSIDNILGNSIRYKLFTSGELSVSDSDIIHVPFGSIIVEEEFETQAQRRVRDNEGFSFTAPLTEPRLEFLEFYDQLDKISFTDVWDLRVPAQTYDHIVSVPHGSEQFITSDQCSGCHNDTNLFGPLPNMTVEVIQNGTTEIVNLSPFGEWSASPMGLAGRDPIFFSQLQGETNILPEHTTCIENLCLHCHGVMGQRQLAIDTDGDDAKGCEEFFGIAPPPQVPMGKPFRLDMVTQWPNSPDNEFQKFGALARDGISCTVCHRVADVDLGEENAYTGNFVTGPANIIFGPYQNVIEKPMQQALGVTPQFGSQITDPGLCGSCHAILLPVFDNDGIQINFSYEQTTYLEWENSVFSQPGPDFSSCQDCHMPTHFDGKELSFEIANIETNMFPPTTNRLPDPEITLSERDIFARHSLHGLNIFINQIFQQFPIVLGYGQLVGFFSDTPALITGQNSMVNMAQNETATVKINELVLNQDGQLEAVIEVRNLTGHYLPSGVGFRRMFLEFLVRDAERNVLWASGRTNKLGAILDGTTEVVLPSEQPVKFPDVPFQPHYDVITEQDQVQIYQELVEDSAGELTTSFLLRVTEVKDNRIRPKGYNPEFFTMNPSPFIQALAVTPGQAASDPYYTDPNLTGSDVIEYLVTLDEEKMSQIHDVKATLYYQSIPPSYLQQRFRDANVGPSQKGEIERLYYITSHLNVDDVLDNDGNSVLKDWKFFISSQTKQIED
jgi:hypothetical protein